MAETEVAQSSLDPELEALPGPRRPWRKATLLTMGLTVALSGWIISGLSAQAVFALRGGAPRELGSLTNVQLTPNLENVWVHGAAELADRSIEYRRPLDADRYRLSEVKGNGNVWVELRIPSGIEPEHYVPPNSFVGRLVPFEKTGLRHRALADDVAEALGHPPSPNAWLLIDGEAPATTRWTLGLILLFLAFVLFNVWGIARLFAPVSVTSSGRR